jgi:Leucine-rich repeat (LRR) protein
MTSILMNNQNISQFPMNLSSNIIVLELNNNNITEIPNNILDVYPKLTHLYILDNPVKSFPDVLKKIRVFWKDNESYSN